MAQGDLKDSLYVIQGGGRKGLRSKSLSFEELYRESYDSVYNYVAFLMAGREGVEDVVAEAFLKAARYFQRFDPSRAKFSTWVISIAQNCMKSHYRSKRPTVALDDVPEAAFSQPGEQDAIDDKHLAAQLLEALGEEERQLVYLKYYEGKRNTEIAEEMGINVSTVSTKLARALERMRASLGKGR